MADISVQEAQGLPAKWKRMIFEQTGTVVSVDGKLYTAANNLIFCGAEDPEVRIILEAIAGAGKPEGKKGMSELHPKHGGNACSAAVLKS